MTRQNGSASDIGSSRPRAVEALREDVDHTHLGLNESPCTLHSSRAELAYKDWNAIPESDRPLPQANALLAKALDQILHARMMRGESAYSNTMVGRHVGLDEKGVRQWRTGEKRIPLAALMTMPASVVIEVIQWVAERRGLERPRGLDASTIARMSKAEALDAVRALTDHIANGAK